MYYKAYLLIVCYSHAHLGFLIKSHSRKGDTSFYINIISIPDRQEQNIAYILYIIGFDFVTVMNFVCLYIYFVVIHIYVCMCTVYNFKTGIERHIKRRTQNNIVTNIRKFCEINVTITKVYTRIYVEYNIFCV